MSEIQKRSDFQNKINQVRLLFPHLDKVSDQEIAKAISLANHLGLDPTKKQVHFVPFKGSIQLITSYTEYIKRAEKSGKLNGWKVDFGKDEIGEYAEITIYRKDWDQDFKWKVYLQEVKQDTHTWKKMPMFMLRKVAIAQGFRMAFPEETAELPYEEAELPQQQNQNQEDTPNSNPSSDNTDNISEAQAKRIYAIMRKKGYTHDDVLGFLKLIGIEGFGELHKSDIELIEKILEKSDGHYMEDACKFIAGRKHKVEELEKFTEWLGSEGISKILSNEDLFKVTVKEFNETVLEHSTDIEDY